MRISVKYIFFGIVALCALIIFLLAVNAYIIRSRAASETIHLSFTPSAVSIVEGEETNVNLILKTDKNSNKISGFDIRFKAKGAVSVLSVGEPQSYPDNDAVSFTQLIKSSERLSYVVIAGNDNLPSIINIPFKITCISAGNGKISVDPQDIQVVGTVEGHVFGVSTIQDIDVTCLTGGDGSISPVPTGISDDKSGKLPYPSVIPLNNTLFAYFIPPQRQIGVGREFSYVFVIEPQKNENRVSGFDVVLSFNPEIAEIVSISEPIDGSLIIQKEKDVQEDFSNELFQKDQKFTQIEKKIDNLKGTAKLTYVSIQKDNELPKKPMLKINMRAKNVGTGVIDFGYIQVVGNIGQSEYNVNRMPSFYTVTKDGNLPPEGGVTINMKLRLQGITTKPKNSEQMQVKVTVGDGFLEKPVSGSGIFTSDDKGVWSGSVFLPVPPGKGYKLLVKPDHHLQKKICDSAPVETYPGTYRCDKGTISLSSQNNFDLSNIYLVVGDLPQQDGIVNSYDISLVRNLLGKTDYESIMLADLNRDGAVNAQDYSLVIEALSIRYDEL